MGEASNAASGAFGILKMVAQMMSAVVLAPIKAVYSAVTRDGAIGASFNQARDELKESLRAFPDAIHVSPVSVSGQSNVYGHEHDRGGIYGSKERVPSPSEIARERGPDSAPQEHGLDNDHGQNDGLDHSRSRGRS